MVMITIIIAPLGIYLTPPWLFAGVPYALPGPRDLLRAFSVMSREPSSPSSQLPTTYVSFLQLL